MNLAKQLAQSLSAINCPAISQKPHTQQKIIQQQVQQYLLLIEKWNKSYNLTAIKTIKEMLYQHIIDSFSIIEYIIGPQIIDVGTGAGLPGIPIAIARPDWQVTLVESNQKKAAFLQQVKIELGLDNITIIAQRIEKTENQKKINTITSRAYASLGVFLKTTQHLIATDNENCRWIAMKSNCSESELQEVKYPFYIKDIMPLNIPGFNAKRELILIGQSINPINRIKGYQT